MVACLIISLLTCAGMVVCVLTGAEIKKMHIPLYWVVTLCGAFVLLVSGMLPLNVAFEALTQDTSVNPLKILVLFLSMTMLSVFLDEAGFFQYLARLVLKRAGKSQIKLFFILYAVVSFLTVFTSNDIIILTFTPFICYFCRSAKIDPLPYLIGEFVAANTFSMMLMIGNPTNIYLALSEGIGFGEYFTVMWLPTLFGGVTAFAVMFAIFYRRLKTPLTVTVERAIPINKPLAAIGLAHLIVCTLLLAVSDFLSLPMWQISLFFALSLFVTVFVYKLVKREHAIELIHTLQRSPWGFVPFLLSMFLLVTALEYNGVTQILADFLSVGESVFVYGAVSTLFCNFVNNIPMSVLFGSVLSASASSNGAVFASIIGSNIGAFLTPVGALAGIMWSNILKGQKVKLGYGKFILYGCIIAVPTLATSLLGLWLIV